jgi:AcrR family transcriptional regulator
LQEWKSGNFDAFHALDSEKQKRIVNAALVEFGTKGFRRASTNAIAENAEIGKGMLFYYFGSKEALFDFLCDYALAFAVNEYVGRYKTESRDFLERYKSLTEIKRATMENYPEFVTFFNSFFQSENAPYFEKCMEEYEKIRADMISKVYDGIDYSLFRDDIDGREAVKYMKWLFDGYEQDIKARFNSGAVGLLDEGAVAEEWRKYYEFTADLRKIFYRRVGSEEGR